MGVLNNKPNRKVAFRPFSGNGDNTGSSEDEGPLNRTETSSDEEIVVEVPRPRVRSRPPPQSPGTSRKTPNFGLTLKLKKGRRARHRYDSERDIFAFANFNPEEVIPDGMDIFQETNSRFRTILDNEKLLNRFLNDEDLGQAQNDKNEASEDDDDDDFDDNDPETSFLRISSHLRQALKKHLPWGILENLEDQILEHFKNNPNECFIASQLSSYERLLAHVCSMYNRLSSQSFDDENGDRKLKIVNPRGQRFQAIDPKLCEYLRIRQQNRVF